MDAQWSGYYLISRINPATAWRVWEKTQNPKLWQPSIDFAFEIGTPGTGIRIADHSTVASWQVQVRSFVVGNVRERDHLGDLGVDGRLILRWNFRKWDVGVWTGLDLAQDRERWRTLVNTVMNLPVP